MQASLLRVLQEKEFDRVGGTESVRVDVRVVAATHRNLEQMVADGSFRQDLYYRLRGIVLSVPPLRERAQDIAELTHHFVRKLSAEHGYKTPPKLSDDAIGWLTEQRWPGNIRELENVIRNALVFCDGDVLNAALLQQATGKRARIPLETVQSHRPLRGDPLGNPYLG